MFNGIIWGSRKWGGGVSSNVCNMWWNCKNFAHMRFVFKDSDEKLDIKVKSRFEWDFFSLGSLFDWREMFQFSLFLHIFAICNESMKTEDDFYQKSNDNVLKNNDFLVNPILG